MSKNRKNKVLKTLLSATAASNAFPISSSAISTTEVKAEVENYNDAIKDLEINKNKMLTVDEKDIRKNMSIPGFVMEELPNKREAEEKGLQAATRVEEVLGAVQEMDALARQTEQVIEDTINAWMKPTGGIFGFFRNYHEDENIGTQRSGFENNMTYVENLNTKSKALIQLTSTLSGEIKIISPTHPGLKTLRQVNSSSKDISSQLDDILNRKTANISTAESKPKKSMQADSWLELNNMLKRRLASTTQTLRNMRNEIDRTLPKLVDDCHNLGAVYEKAESTTTQQLQKSLSDKWEKDYAELIEKQKRSYDVLNRIKRMMEEDDTPRMLKTDDLITNKTRLEAEIAAEKQRVKTEFLNTKTKLQNDLQTKLDNLKQSLDNSVSNPDDPDYDVNVEANKEIQPLLAELDQTTSEKLTEIESLDEYSEYNAKALEELLVYKQTQAAKVGEINRQLAREKAKYKTFKKRMSLKQKELTEKTKQCDYKIEEFLFNIKTSLGGDTYDEFMKRQGAAINEVKNQVETVRKNIQAINVNLGNPNLESQLNSSETGDLKRLEDKINERVDNMTGVAIGINTQVLLREVQGIKDQVEEKIKRMEAYKPDTLPDGFTDIAEGLWKSHQDSNKIMRDILNDTVKMLKQSKQITLSENANATAVLKAKGFANDYFDLTKEIEDKFIAMIETYKSRKSQMDAWDLVFKNNNVAQTAINRLNALRAERGLPSPTPGEISATERELVRENTEVVLRGSHEIADVLLDGLLSDNGHPVDALIVSGKSGSGKTETVKTVAAQLNIDIHNITKNDIDRGGIQLANQILQRAKNGAPTLVLWDECATGVIADTKNPMSGNVSDTMNEHINFIDRLREQTDGRIVYVMTTNAREDYMHPPIKGRCKKCITLDASGKSAMEAINGILDAIPTADWIETAQERSKKVQDAYSLKMRTNSSSMLGLRGLKQAVINAQNKAFDRMLKAWEKRRAANVDLSAESPAAPEDTVSGQAATTPSKDFPFDDVREKVILYSKREEKPCLQLTYVTSDEIIQELNKQ